MKNWLMGIISISAVCCEAGMKIVAFDNESDLKFNPTFCNGMPVIDTLIDQLESCIWTEDDKVGIVFEDAADSGYFHPEWKFHIWLEVDGGLPFLSQDRLLFAVIFYDDDGEVSLHLDKDQKLKVIPGKNVKDILYPWAKGTLGRGNPYHEIQGVESDEKGIKYFDYNGFVGYLETL